MKYHIMAFYLIWRNDYLTHEKMAEHFGLDVATVKALIEQGRTLCEENAAVYKRCGYDDFGDWVRRNEYVQYYHLI